MPRMVDGTARPVVSITNWSRTVPAKPRMRTIGKLVRMRSTSAGSMAGDGTVKTGNPARRRGGVMVPLTASAAGSSRTIQVSESRWSASSQTNTSPFRLAVSSARASCRAPSSPRL